MRRREDEGLRRQATPASASSTHHSCRLRLQTCCRLQQCVSGAVSHPCMRLPAQLPGSLSHLPTNLFCNEWCAGSQRPASLGRPWGPLVPPARARYKSGRLRRRSSPVAATGDHQAVAQLQATLPRHGTPRPACPVRLVSTSDSSSSRKDTLGFQPAQQQPPPPVPHAPSRAKLCCRPTARQPSTHPWTPRPHFF